MPGSNIRILSTRPLDAGLLEQAAGKGIIIDTLSFIATEPLGGEALKARIHNISLKTAVVVFTSMNAVEAVAADLRQPTPWKIFCIGAATRQLVLVHFGEASIAGTASSAAELADVILRRPPSEVFFFCGDLRRDELPDKLSLGGVKVNEVVVYRTTQTPHKTNVPYDGVAFFSPSAVHSFFSVNELSGKTRIFAIGSTTAEAIRMYWSGHVTISGSPAKETLVHQMIDDFSK